MQKKSKKGLLFELSGEHPKLPRAELESILKTVLNKFYIVSDQNGKTEDISDTSHGSNRLLVIETEEYSSKLINELSIRLAMTHSINEILAHYWVRNKTLADEASMIRNQLVGGLEEFKSLKKGRTFKLTTNRLGTRNRFSKDMIKTISASIIRELSETMRVNVTDPDVEIVLFITDELFLVEKLCDINRSAFETRKPQLRPYFAPISLHPRMARCLVNLAVITENNVLLDPFCGTGGILLEAGLMGIPVVGLDINERMAAGTIQNLNHYGITEYSIEQGDIESAFDLPSLSAASDLRLVIVTEPPYGRSTTTQGEGLESLMRRAFNVFNKLLSPGHCLVISLPDPMLAKFAGRTFKTLNKFEIRIHRSLTKYIFVFERIA